MKNHHRKTYQPLKEEGVIYNQPIPYAKIDSHDGWLTALEDDVYSLRAFRDIVYHERGKSENLMAFYVRKNTTQDELRALGAGILGSSGDADGSVSLYNCGAFLRVAHAPEARGEK